MDSLSTLVLTFLLNLRFNPAIPISRIITGRYGPHCLRIFRSLENVSKKLTKAELDHQYLRSCKAYNIFPNFLRFKLYKQSLTTTDLYREFQQKLLDKEMFTKERLVDHHKETKAALDGGLSEIVSAVDFHALCHFLTRKISRYRQSVQETHERKLSSLGGRLHLSSCKPEKVIFNYSNRKLNQREEFLLSFGLDFNLPIHKLSFFKYFLPVEKLISCLKDCSIRDGYNLDRVVERIKSVSFNVYYKFKSNNIFSPIFNKSDVNLLKTLGKDQHIVICPPDKGRGVVILNKNDYVGKMETILSDNTKFEHISNVDPFLTMVRLEDRIKQFS